MPAMRLTPVVRWLIIINVSAFLLHLIGDTFFGLRVLESFALIPSQLYEKYYFWQLFTYQFMHSDLFHILFNMLILWMIGSELEAQWGTKFFLKFYLVCGTSSGLFYLLVQLFLKGTVASMIPMVGSSGAVYGLLVAYGIIYSERTLLFMMVFPMKAKHFVLLLAALEFISTVFYSSSGVANAAHLGGMIVGFLYLFLKAYLRLRLKEKSAGSSGKKKRRRRSHLRLVVNNQVFKEFDTDEDSDEDRDDPDRPTFH